MAVSFSLTRTVRRLPTKVDNTLIIIYNINHKLIPPTNFSPWREKMSLFWKARKGVQVEFP
jgi:hypothetical protein